jgi:hypothetical protein
LFIEFINLGTATAEYLAPFTKRAGKNATKISIPASNDTIDVLTNDSLWSPTTSTNHSSSTPLSPAIIQAPPPTTMGHTTWICKLTSALTGSPYVRDDILQLCGDVCKVRNDFAEILFPYLVRI